MAQFWGRRYLALRRLHLYIAYPAVSSLLPNHSYKRILLFLLTAFGVGTVSACDIDFNIDLQTFGEGVTVELRFGVPGRSKVVRTAQSRGGNVQFGDLCPGNYFLAIGNGDNVSVTPVRQFQENVRYNSRITLQRGSGNVSKSSRKSL